MSGSYVASVDGHGRILLGAPLILAETDAGVVIMTRNQARQRIAEQLQGKDLVRELIDERREAAAREDPA